VGILLAMATILYLWPRLPSSISGDLVLPFSLPPPEQFWIVSTLVLAQVVVAYLFLRERGRLRKALSRKISRKVSRLREEPEPELRPYAPIPEEEVEYVEAPAEEAEEYVEDVHDNRPLPAAPAAEGRRDGEFSKLLDWIDDVSEQISGWASDVMESADHTVHPKKTAPATPLVLADREDRGTAKTSVPKLGAWTETRAKSAIEKFLRKRPWAPAADIAKELGMDIRLATRVTATVREESVR